VNLAFEQTPHRRGESLHWEVVRGSSYNATWHFHPECQLTLVLKSNGYRLVGDRITPLRPGDLVLVGANLPHVWYQEASRHPSRAAVHAIVVRFLEGCFGNDFLELPELWLVRRLLKRARRGLQVTGKTREAVAANLRRLSTATGLDRVAGFISILSVLAQSEDLKPIASPGFAPTLSDGDQNRVARVIDFVHAHFEQPVSRAAVAAEAHLSLSAFSRFFKLRTGKTLPQYVNELRVGRACSLLADEQLKVTDLAMECGFQNLANFNRRFREITKLSPREYRRQLQASMT
jgi:AraC-like DNA-binding protein